MILEDPFKPQTVATVNQVLRFIRARRQAGLQAIRTGTVLVDGVGSLGMTPLFVACYGLWVVGVDALLGLGAIAQRTSSGMSMSTAVLLGTLDSLETGRDDSILLCVEIMQLLNNRCAARLQIAAEIPVCLVVRVRERASEMGYKGLVCVLSP